MLFVIAIQSSYAKSEWHGLSGLSHVLRVGRFPSHLEVDVWRSSASSDVGGRKGHTVRYRGVGWLARVESVGWVSPYACE